MRTREKSGTLAWFVASQSVTITDDAAKGAFTVAQTSGESLTLTAKIHFVCGDANDDIKLTTWGVDDGESATVDTETPANNVDLVTAYKANAGASVTYQRLGSSAGWTYIPVKAWIEATADGGDMGAWRQAVKDATSNYTGNAKYTYDSKVDTSKLLSTEVFYYKVDGTSAPGSYVKANESSAATRGTTGVSFSVSAKSLVDDHEDLAHALVLGYLVVRAEGSLRDHSTAVTYSAQIDATATIS